MKDNILRGPWPEREDEQEQDVPFEPPLNGTLVKAKPIAGFRRVGSAALVNERGPHVLQLLLEGHSLNGACALVGVGVRTVREWIEKGTENDDRPAKAEYAVFADAYRAVMAVVERELLGCVEAAARGIAPQGSKPNWEAAKFLLQVKFPRTYKDTDVAIEGTPSRIVVVEAPMTDERRLGQTAYAATAEVAPLVRGRGDQGGESEGGEGS